MNADDGSMRSGAIVARWAAKFADAGAGVAQGIATEASIRVHLTAAMLVILTAGLLGVETWRWSVLLICITVVIVAEYFNSSIERLVRVLHPDRDEALAAALHLAAGGVLVAATGAATVGTIVLLPSLWQLLAG